MTDYYLTHEDDDREYGPPFLCEEEARRFVAYCTKQNYGELHTKGPRLLEDLQLEFRREFVCQVLENAARLVATSPARDAMDLAARIANEVMQ